MKYFKSFIRGVIITLAVVSLIPFLLIAMFFAWVFDDGTGLNDDYYGRYW